MADDAERRLLEDQLELQLQEQRESIAALDEALASDPQNPEILEVHAELLQAIKHAEEGLFVPKRARLLQEVDTSLQMARDGGKGINQDSLDSKDVEAEPLKDSDDVKQDPLDPKQTKVDSLKEFSIGSKCRFRHSDGRWYDGLIVAIEGSNDAKVSFLTPTSENQLICKFFLQQRCRFGTKCRFSHASKFESLVERRENSWAKIERVFELPDTERTFGLVQASVNLSSDHCQAESSSSMKKGGSKFDLADLSGYISGATMKKEKATLPVSKHKAPNLRSSKKTTKKRKGIEGAKPSMFEDLSAMDVLKKLSGLCAEGLEKVGAEIGKMEADIQSMEADHLQTIQDLKKLAQARMVCNNQMEGEITKLKAELAEIQVKADMKVEEAIDDAMRSASIAVLQSKIKMAKEASVDGFSANVWTKNLDEWKANLVKLQGTSAVEVEEAVEIPEEATVIQVGNDGKNGKA